MAYHPAPRVNGSGRDSSFEREGPLAKGAMFSSFERGGVHGHGHKGSNDSNCRKFG